MTTHDETYRGFRIWRENGVWFIGRGEWFFEVASREEARAGIDELLG